MKYFTTILIITIVIIPTLALAQGYSPLVGIPGVNPDQDFNGYINTLYALSIGIAALLAVIKIIIAGVKWMMSDVVTNKMEAKEDIKGALLGLLIVLGAVLIITVINPDILKVNLQMNQIQTSGSASSVISPTNPTASPTGSQPLLPFHTVATDSIYNDNQTKASCDSLGGDFYPDNGVGTPTCVVHATQN